MNSKPYFIKNGPCFDVTSIKAKEVKVIQLRRLFNIISILAVLIFSIPFISGCSSKAPSVTAPQSTVISEATIATSPTPADTTVPTSTPPAETTAAATVAPSPVATTAPTPASTAVPQQITITDASEKLSEMGFDEYNQFRYDNAINYFDQAISADPYNYKAYNGKGIALCFKGSYSTGMPLIQRALDMKPDYSYGYFNMAMAYKLQKDYDNSLNYFNKAISLDPKDTWSYYGIATIYADRGDINASLDFLKKAIDLDPAVKDVAREQDHFQPYLNNEAFKKLVS